jgi:hypothetical protein
MDSSSAPVNGKWVEYSKERETMILDVETRLVAPFSHFIQTDTSKSFA